MGWQLRAVLVMEAGVGKSSLGDGPENSASRATYRSSCAVESGRINESYTNDSVWTTCKSGHTCIIATLTASHRETCVLDISFRQPTRPVKASFITPTALTTKGYANIGASTISPK
jgi:hypothetical protein